MKKADVVGKTYLVKVSQRVVPVRIDRACEYGGWFGTNTITGREVRVRTAARLRREHAPLLPVIATDGQDVAEYAIMLAVILALVIGVIELVGTNSGTVFSNIASSIS